MQFAQLLATGLRALPSPVRRALYALMLVVGAGLSALQAAGVDSVGGLTLTRALQIYAYLAPLTGVVAVANVSPSSGSGMELPPVDDTVDLSSFEPVGDGSDVFVGATT
jgi:hypothetical protein